MSEHDSVRKEGHSKRAIQVIAAVFAVSLLFLLIVIFAIFYSTTPAWLTVERLRPDPHIDSIGISFDSIVEKDGEQRVQVKLGDFLKLHEAITKADGEYDKSRKIGGELAAHAIASVIATNSEGNRLIEAAEKKDLNELIPRTSGTESFVIQSDNGNLYFLTIEFKDASIVTLNR